MNVDARNYEELERALQRILWALRAYLADLVIIGGWVPYLYRQYGPFPWTGRLALTGEVDVLIGRQLAPGDRPPITEILTASGFRPASASDTPAVWMKDPDRGEKVEFMVPHAGHIGQLQAIVPIRHQRGLGGISLSSLEVMQQHTRRLTVPALRPERTGSGVEVQLPQLGAYVLNKGVTFLRRNTKIAPEKKAKDLLYLRDLMVAGSEIVAMIDDDVRLIEGDDRTRHLLDIAMSNLESATRNERDLLIQVSQILAERDGLSFEASQADVEGHLIDLLDVLRPYRSPDFTPVED